MGGFSLELAQVLMAYQLMEPRPIWKARKYKHKEEKMAGVTNLEETKETVRPQTTLFKKLSNCLSSVVNVGEYDPAGVEVDVENESITLNFHHHGKIQDVGRGGCTLADAISLVAFIQEHYEGLYSNTEAKININDNRFNLGEVLRLCAEARRRFELTALAKGRYE